MSWQKSVGAVGEMGAASSIMLWIGGHIALGAFAARILFRDQARAVAAPAMTTIFRSFDKLILAAIVLLALFALLRMFGYGLASLADRVALTAAGLLCALGLFEVLHVHAAIEMLFDSGRTLEPQFASLHKLSERCAHLELFLALVLYGSFAWSRQTDRLAS